MSTKKRKREKDANSVDPSGATSLEPHEEEVLRRFLGGLSLDEPQALAVSWVIARQVQLSLPPDIETIQTMSRYRRLFGSRTSPFNSMEWIHFLEKSNQVREGPLRKNCLYKCLEEDEVTQSLECWRHASEESLKIQESELSPELTIRMTEHGLALELKLHNARVGQITKALEDAKVLLADLLGRLEEVSVAGLEMVNEKSRRHFLTFGEHGPPPSFMAAIYEIEKTPNTDLDKLYCASLLALYRPVELLRYKICKLYHLSCDIRAIILTDAITEEHEDAQFTKVLLHKRYALVDQLVKFYQDKKFLEQLSELEIELYSMTGELRDDQRLVTPQERQAFNHLSDRSQDNKIYEILKNPFASQTHIIETDSCNLKALKIKALIRNSTVDDILGILLDYLHAFSGFDYSLLEIDTP